MKLTYKELGSLLVNKGYIRGPFGSALRRNELKDYGVPVYEQQHAIYNHREFRYYIGDQKYDTLKRFTVSPNDLIISCSGTLGRISIINDDDPKGIISQALLILRPDLSEISVKYLYYYLTSHDGYNSIVSRSLGAAQTNIAKREVVEKIKIPLPPLPVQKKIASILSAYDDLIENNLRRIELLEQSARELYKEWFIRFKFPGHEKVKMVDGIPDGWEYTSLLELSNKITDGSHSSPKSVDNGFPMASVKDMNYWGLKIDNCRKISRIDFEKLQKSDCQPKVNDVLIAKDGSYLKHVFVVQKNVDVVILSSIAILRPKENVSSYFIVQSLLNQNHKERLKNYVSGSAVPRIVLKEFKKFELLYPSKEVINKFDEYMIPLCSFAVQLLEQNQKLRQARDLLLPRLMKGEIDL